MPEAAEVEETPIPTSPGWVTEDSDETVAATAPTIPAYTPVRTPDDLDHVPSAAPIPSVEDDSRIVRAASNRVDGNFKLGKNNGHAITVIAAGVVALVCVLGGAAAGSLVPLASETLAFNDETTATGDELDEEAEQAWRDAYGDAFVAIELDGCGVGASGIHGVALDPRIVLVAATEVESDTSPTIVAQDGTRYSGQTVGVLGTTGVAIVRLATPLPTHLSWGAMLNVTEGMDVRIASFSNGTVSIQNGMITQLRQNSSGVVGMDVVPETGRGSVVIDENNLVVGLLSRNGTFAADADELSPRVSDAVLNPSQVLPVCPTPEPVEDSESESEPEPGEGSEGADG